MNKFFQPKTALFFLLSLFAISEKTLAVNVCPSFSQLMKEGSIKFELPLKGTEIFSTEEEFYRAAHEERERRALTHNVSEDIKNITGYRFLGFSKIAYTACRSGESKKITDIFDDDNITLKETSEEGLIGCRYQGYLEKNGIRYGVIAEVGYWPLKQ